VSTLVATSAIATVHPAGVEVRLPTLASDDPRDPLPSSCAALDLPRCRVSQHSLSTIDDTDEGTNGRITHFSGLTVFDLSGKRSTSGPQLLEDRRWSCLGPEGAVEMAVPFPAGLLADQSRGGGMSVPVSSRTGRQENAWRRLSVTVVFPHEIVRCCDGIDDSGHFGAGWHRASYG
jgi:hypothetical protein